MVNFTYLIQFHGETRSGLRAKSYWNRAKSGPGMQAIFLGPKRKSCGTGVFIPRGHETDLQFTKKPGIVLNNNISLFFYINIGLSTFYIFL